MTKFLYTVVEHDPEHSYSFECNHTEDWPEWVAEDAAHDFYRENEYWNPKDWPLTFIIKKEDGTELGRFEVYMDYEPTFSAAEAPAK